MNQVNLLHDTLKEHLPWHRAKLNFLVILMGEWLHEQTPLKIKKHAGRAKSIFRYGLDYLRCLLMDLYIKYNKLIHPDYKIFVLYLEN